MNGNKLYVINIQGIHAIYSEQHATRELLKRKFLKTLKCRRDDELIVVKVRHFEMFVFLQYTKCLLWIAGVCKAGF